ncbi:hypothetical protein B0H12DRAFT_157648 [Mycena haematopus]|nr:hypothetical protein B0H12DRAFT_157648 [Mycena haematopus]
MRIHWHSVACTSTATYMCARRAVGPGTISRPGRLSREPNFVSMTRDEVVGMRLPSAWFRERPTKSHGDNELQQPRVGWADDARTRRIRVGVLGGGSEDVDERVRMLVEVAVLDEAKWVDLKRRTTDRDFRVLESLTNRSPSSIAYEKMGKGGGRCEGRLRDLKGNRDSDSAHLEKRRKNETNNSPKSRKSIHNWPPSSAKIRSNTSPARSVTCACVSRTSASQISSVSAKFGSNSECNSSSSESSLHTNENVFSRCARVSSARGNFEEDSFGLAGCWGWEYRLCTDGIDWR